MPPHHDLKRALSSTNRLADSNYLPFYSGKADVWALGAVVYAMAVGDPAPEALATQPRARLVSEVGHQTGSEALARVAHRALDPDPSRRPSAHQVTRRFLLYKLD